MNIPDIFRRWNKRRFEEKLHAHMLEAKAKFEAEERARLFLARVHEENLHTAVNPRKKQSDLNVTDENMQNAQKGEIGL